MQSEFLFSILFSLGLLVLFIFINRKFSQLSKQNKTDEALLEWLKSMQQSMDINSKSINSTLQSHSKTLNERLDNATRVIAGVQKNIGEMSEIGRGMRELQEFLRSPKLRGNIGEQVLKELLGQMLPKSSFHLQYSFKSGSIVDAAITTEAGIIPIDSKFPMESFRRLSKSESESEKKEAEKELFSDVKKHIDSISKKYILTNEGTIDYALMYVPSESVYYEIINNPSLFDYSSSKRVLPVSPMTFYAYLKAILMGFEGQKISKKAQEILSGIRAIQKEYEKLGDGLDILGKHVNNSYNSMSQINTTYSKLGQQIKTTSTIDKEDLELLPNKNA